MRLSEQTQSVIREAVKELFGPEATVSVFGSRIDDNAKGGDIDLLVRSQYPVPQRQRKALQLVARLQIRLGDQPIDVLVVDPDTVLETIHEHALLTGTRI